MKPSIRDAVPADLAFLPAVEEASDTLLDGMTSVEGMPVLPPPATVPELAASLHLLVAGNPPVGYARLEEIDGQAHLEQLSVHPDAAGVGLGRALVQAALDWAREQGYVSMTLCTFADVPFNAPFYASCGFETVPEPDGELAALRDHEISLGLDALGRRVAMRRDLLKPQDPAGRTSSIA